MGRPDDGLRRLREAVLSDPDLADAHYNLALMLVSAGDKRDALSELSEALSLDPGNSDARIVADNLLHGQSHTSSER
jgi:tetratricopeptide (TPR) repeat protein